MGISTGGVVPDGADAVIPIEYVVEHDNTVEIDASAEPGANVRPRGGDIRSGEVVCPAGTRLGPAQLGALAAAGVAELSCARRPRVAVLTTGTELRPPGEPLGPGEVYEANGLMLAAAARLRGRRGRAARRGRGRHEAHRAAIARGLEADVLVTSGGVSVGRHDLVRPVLAELGAEEVFWRVAVKPGKPVAFGVRGSTLVFGLPGNPVSSLVGFELFVRPAVLALQGVRSPLPRFEPGRLARAVRRSAPGTSSCERAARPATGRSCSSRSTGQESHMIARAATADALVLVPRGEGELAAGAAVRYLAPAAPSSRRRRGAASRGAGARERRRGGSSSRNGPRGGAPHARVRGVAPAASALSCRRRRPPRGDERRRGRDVADDQRARAGTRARRSRGRSERERAEQQRRPDQAEASTPSGPGARRRASCGSQSQACSDGSRKISANGLVATTSSATTPRPSSAPCGRRAPPRAGTAPRREPLARTTSQPRARARRARERERPASGSRPRSRAGRERRAARARRRRGRGTRTSPRRRARSRAGCGGCAAPAPSGDAAAAAAGEEIDGGDEERQQHRDQDELDRPAADDPARRARRSSTSPGRARAPGRASRGAAASRGRSAASARPVRRPACRRTRGRAVAGGRDRHRRDAAATNGPARRG